MYDWFFFGNLYSFYDVDYVTRIGREVMEREEIFTQRDLVASKEISVDF